jgi:hypothetical protein
MNSTMMMERTGMAMPGMGVPGMGTPTMGAGTGAATGANWLVVPRCTLKLEKCTGGMKLSCICDDKMACSMMQNLCTMLAGGMCSCCVQLNGMTVCVCNFTMGLCKCELTETGVCLTCTSGDTKCCEMIQAYCDCLSTLLNSGCTCCVLMNNTPLCCGTTETSHQNVAKTTTQAKR